MQYTFAIVLIILIAAVPAAAQNKNDVGKRVEQAEKQLSPVKAYVTTVTDWVNEVEFPQIVVADIADYNDEGEPVWKRYDSQRAFEEANLETYTTAFIWIKRKRILQVNFTYSSPSGDWVQYVFHTFYPNGRAASIDRELRTFMGDVIVNRVTYYDRSGKLLATNESFRDLTTQKPIERPEGFLDMEAAFFTRTADLPFTSLLKQ